MYIDCRALAKHARGTPGNDAQLHLSIEACRADC